MLFTFPSRYWFTIGLPGVFSLTRWSWQIHTGFLVSRATQDTAGVINRCVYRTVTVCGQSFQYCSTSDLQTPYGSPTTPMMPEHHWFGLIPFRSPLLRESLLFYFPPGTEMFQFSGLASRLIGISGLQPDGLPHSDIRGSPVICTSPRLIAAYHVLLRLWEPRHPPYALNCFFICGDIFSQYVKELFPSLGGG